jgi:hypothetical protein
LPRKETDYALLTLRTREALRKRVEQAAEANHRSLNSELIERLERSFRDTQTEKILELLLGEPADTAMVLTHVARALRLSGGWMTNTDTRKVLRIAIDLLIEACAKGKVPDRLPPEITADKLTPDVKQRAMAMAILLFEPRETIFKPVKEEDAQ